MNKPMFGFDFGYMQDGVTTNTPLGTTDRPDCPDFQESRAVTKLQNTMVADQRSAGGIGVDLGEHGVDGRYGPYTQTSAANWYGWLAQTRLGADSASYSSTWVRSGPNAAAALLITVGFTTAEIEELQKQWHRWNNLIKPCIERAPGEGAGDGAGPGIGEDTGMGAGKWLLLLGIGAAVAGTIYYVATEK